MAAPEPEDRKDPKRARVVLSKDREVVGLGYSRVIGVAARVIDKRENLGNHDRVSKTEQHYPSWVNRVNQNSNMDRQADRVGQATRVSPNSSTDQQTDQVSQVSRDSRVGNTEHKKGGSSRVANTEVWVMDNLANTESRVTENSVNMENWVVQDSGARNQRKENVLLQAKA
jgi:hypothetical protein